MAALSATSGSTFDVKEALQNDRVEPFFEAQQPLDDPDRIVAVESLARARTLNGEVITPNILIPAALQQETAAKLHQILTQKSLQFAADNGVRISINVLDEVLANPHFAEELADQIEQARIDGENVTVELLEGTNPVTLKRARKTLNKLSGRTRLSNGRHLRVAASADDFPNNHANRVFEEIRRVADEVQLKVDWQVVRSLEMSESQKIINWAINKARKRGASIVFEGVEPGEEDLRVALMEKTEDLPADRTFVQIGRPETAAQMRRILRGEASLQRH